MANHKSAEKRARQSIRKNKINTQTMGAVRTVERKLRTAITKKDKKVSQELLIDFASRVAKAAQKGRVRTETASRKIGRLSKAVHAIA